MKIDDIFEEIQKERLLQDNKWGTPRKLDNKTWLTVLAEEFGEVARAILEHDENNLFDELIDVAAVCIAWLEYNY